jgi:hypothetical protein
MMQSSKTKDTTEAHSLAQTRSLVDNTQTTTTWTVPSGSAIPKKTRRIPTTVRTGSQPHVETKKKT